jgi:TM2 domain-containing membrane protein YozV
MRLLRSIAAVVGGLGFMAATVTVGTLLASGLFGAPQQVAGKPAAGILTAYLLVNLAICGLGAVLGGWLAARIASFAPYGHAAVMAAIVAALSVTTATGTPDAGQPDWYPPLLGLVAVLGILLGGKLRAAAASAGPVVA